MGHEAFRMGDEAFFVPVIAAAGFPLFPTDVTEFVGAAATVDTSAKKQ